MDEKEFLRDKGFQREEKGKFVRKRGDNKQYVDINKLNVWVHDENHKFDTVPEKLYSILDVVERMQDMNQRELDEWIDGLDNSKRQLRITDYMEE